MKKTLVGALIIVCILAALFAVMRARAPKSPAPTMQERWAAEGIPVKTSVMTRGDVERTVDLTGDINALDRTTLSAKIAGRVSSVSAREGDIVARGAVVITLDQQDLQSNLQAALAGLESAVARLSQAKTNATVTKIQTNAAVEQARAQLEAAQARLAVAKNPSRSQERVVAENAVNEAKANLDRAEADYRRNQSLVKQGAISQSTFELVETTYKVAQSQHRSAAERLSMIKEGGRSEDISQAQAQVNVAVEGLRTAKAGESQNLLRKEDVRQASAALSQARAAVAMARQQLSYSYVRSPISGTLSARNTEPGQVVSPGQPLGEVVGLASIYFKGEISEQQIVDVRPGQRARVKVDAQAGRTFAGVVDKVYPAGSTSSRVFNVSVRITDPNSGIRPGMFARGQIVVGTQRGVLLAPKDSIAESKGTKVIFTLTGKNRVRRHVVTVVRENSDHVQITEPCDLKAGDVVVTAGCQNLQDGSKVLVRDGK